MIRAERRSIMPTRTGVLIRAGVLLALALISPISLIRPIGLLAQQHGYTPQDIENGGQIYQTSCATCHGPEGDGIAGVNLGSGKFRRATTDDELVRIIIGGIPGTAMPPSNYSEGQAGTIVAYVRSLSASPAGTTVPGDAGRGKSIFEGKGQCLTCHSVGGVGARIATALTEIGALRRAVELQRSIVDPAAEVRSDNRSVRVVTHQGETMTGRLFNQDTFTIQLLDASERLRLVDKASVREYTILAGSPMPSYRDRLNVQELADLVSYLTTLKGRR
jgi:putative heme-binding domain-containing protein